MASTNIHIYPSPLTHESRILRITDALAKAAIFDQIEVYGVSAPDQMCIRDRPKAFSPTRSAP